MTFNRRNKPVEITDAPERHYIAPMEFRDDSEDENVVKLSGYASTFESYEMYGGPAQGGWIEQIARGAFEKTLREKPDLHLLVNHAGMPLARTKSGTLKLSVDDHGLRVDAELDRRDPEVQALEVKMRRGDMDEMSFAFRVKAQEWEATADFPDDDMALRTITEVSLHKGDVSVVNFGANPTTSASVRSVEEALKIIAECGADELAEARGEGDILRQAQEKLGVNAQVVIENLHATDLRSDIDAINSLILDADRLVAELRTQDSDELICSFNFRAKHADGKWVVEVPNGHIADIRDRFSEHAEGGDILASARMVRDLRDELMALEDGGLAQDDVEKARALRAKVSDAEQELRKFELFSAFVHEFVVEERFKDDEKPFQYLYLTLDKRDENGNYTVVHPTGRSTHLARLFADIDESHRKKFPEVMHRSDVYDAEVARQRKENPDAQCYGASEEEIDAIIAAENAPKRGMSLRLAKALAGE